MTWASVICVEGTVPRTHWKHIISSVARTAACPIVTALWSDSAGTGATVTANGLYTAVRQQRIA